MKNQNNFNASANDGFHAVVCIKQVPDTVEVKINPETNTLVREGVKSIINPFDMYAIEEAVRLKEKFGGKTTVLSMGPPQAEAALREAISLGIDEAILLSDRLFAGSDTLATSYTLAQAIKKIGNFSIILCGKQASDGDTAQVGPGISTHLDIPQVTYVKKIEEIKDNVAKIQRMTEEGYEVLETPLPCLLTVVKEINVPRLPSLKSMMRSKSAKIRLLTVQELDCEETRLGLKGSPTQVIKIFTPQRRKGAEVFQGPADECVENLINAIGDQLQ